jgi:hypothetical protein
MVPPLRRALFYLALPPPFVSRALGRQPLQRVSRAPQGVIAC